MEEQEHHNTSISPENNNDFEARCEKLIAEDYEFKFSEYINQGFDIFKKDAGAFIGYLIIALFISIACAIIPILGPLLSMFITPPLYAGYFIVAKKIIHNEPYEFGDFFKGFDYLVQLFLGNLIVSIFVTIGIVFCIIPGIYLAVAYIWVTMFIVFAGLEFWPAMEMSRKVITKNWFSFLGFIIVLGLINLLGLLALGVGLLVTIPSTKLALFAAYNDIVGTNRQE